jgi:hypothetical protein
MEFFFLVNYQQKKREIEGLDGPLEDVTSTGEDEV